MLPGCRGMLRLRRPLLRRGRRARHKHGTAGNSNNGDNCRAKPMYDPRASICVHCEIPPI